jgi:hypothetical protein
MAKNRKETQQNFAQVKSSRHVSPLRQILPEGWKEASEQILEKIAALAQAESRRILAEWEKAPGISESTPRQQAKAYAAVVGSEIPFTGTGYSRLIMRRVISHIDW